MVNLEELLRQSQRGNKHMFYKGIKTENKWNNGNWYTHFSMGGEIIKTVEWRGSFGDDEIRNVIDKDILPFI